MAIRGTLGQVLINDALPEDMRDYKRVLDKKGMTALLREVAEKHPEKYRDISFRMQEVGRDAAQESGGMSFGLQHMRKAKAAVETRQRIRTGMRRILNNPRLTPDQRRDAITKLVGKEMKPQQEAIFEEALAADNPLAKMVLSGSRGNKMNLASLLGSDLLYADHHDRPIPIPVLHSYSEGLTPAEYWAGAYGARKGVTSAKFATQDAGFLSKQLNQIGHRLVVEDDDYDEEEQRNIMRGMPVDTDDMDNEGALLAHDIGGYKKNTHLTPKVLKHLKRQGHDRILVRSPMVGGSPAGGIYARDAGVRETGKLAGRGEMVGLQAAQALSEPLSQAQLSAKHSGGVAGEEKAVSGFDYINQLIQVPKSFKGGAAHSTLDGTVQRIEKAPAGGHYVTINDEQHYVGQGFDLKIKKGDEVEAGDVISEGIPSPQKIVQYKGVGEGRAYFSKAMREAYADAGIKANRRNIEILARGLINNVRVTEEYGDNVPDDVIPYSTLEHTYKPRDGHQMLDPKRAVGKYLERPIMHYTIGTKVRPSMLKEMEHFGVKELAVHDNPPPFQPEMIRGMYSLQHDPDWMVRFYGSGLKKSFLDSVHRGRASEERGTSFVPSLARSTDFGHTPGGIIQQPQPGKAPAAPSEEQDPQDTTAQGASWFGGKLKPNMPSLMPKAALDNTIGDFIEKQANNPPGAVQPPKPQQPKSMGAGPPSPAGASNPWMMKPTGPQASPPLPGTSGGFNGTFGTRSSGGMFSNPMGAQFAPQFIQSMNQALPGIGGVAGIGFAMNANAMNTLLGNKTQRYGAAGYDYQGQPLHMPTGTGAVPGGHMAGGYGQQDMAAMGTGQGGIIPDWLKPPEDSRAFDQSIFAPAMSKGLRPPGWMRSRMPWMNRFLTGRDATGATKPGALGQTLQKTPVVGKMLGLVDESTELVTKSTKAVDALRQQIQVAQEAGKVDDVAALTAKLAQAEDAAKWTQESAKLLQESTALRDAGNMDEATRMATYARELGAMPKLNETASGLRELHASYQQAGKTEKAAKVMARINQIEDANQAFLRANEARKAVTLAQETGQTADRIAELTKLANQAEDAARVSRIQSLRGLPRLLEGAKGLPGVARAGSALSTAGRWLGPIGYVIDAGLTTHGVATKGFDPYANETAQEYRDILTGKHGLWTPLSAVGVVFSPTRNVQLIASGGKQTVETAIEVADVYDKVNQAAYERTTDDLAGRSPSGLATELDQIDMDVDDLSERYYDRSVADRIFNLYENAGQGTEALLQAGKLKGSRKAQREHDEQQTRNWLYTRGSSNHMNDLRAMERAWVQAGSPAYGTNEEWDRVYPRGARDDYQSYIADTGKTTHALRHEDSSFGKLLEEDVWSRDVHIPFFNDNTVIPGTDYGIRSIWEMMDEGTFNPLYSRSKTYAPRRERTEAEKLEAERREARWAAQAAEQRRLRSLEMQGMGRTREENLAAMTPAQRAQWQQLYEGLSFRSPLVNRQIYNRAPVYSHNPRHAEHNRRMDREAENDAEYQRMIERGLIPGVTATDPRKRPTDDIGYDLDRFGNGYGSLGGFDRGSLQDILKSKSETAGTPSSPEAQQRQELLRKWIMEGMPQQDK